MIELSHLAGWIDTSLKKDPPEEILSHCGDFYSPYYFFMYLAAFALPGVAVELGVESGRGAASIALAGKRIFGIDTNKNPNIEALQARFPKFVFLHQPSLPVPDTIRESLAPISLLHIDTEHSFAMAKAEFEAYQPYLVKPAIVVFDDLHAAEDDVLKYFMKLPYPKIQDDRMHPQTGWGVVLYL